MHVYLSKQHTFFYTNCIYYIFAQYDCNINMQHDTKHMGSVYVVLYTYSNPILFTINYYTFNVTFEFG